MEKRRVVCTQATRRPAAREGVIYVVSILVVRQPSRPAANTTFPAIRDVGGGARGRRLVTQRKQITIVVYLCTKARYGYGVKEPLESQRCSIVPCELLIEPS